MKRFCPYLISRNMPTTVIQRISKDMDENEDMKPEKNEDLLNYSKTKVKLLCIIRITSSFTFYQQCQLPLCRKNFCFHNVTFPSLQYSVNKLFACGKTYILSEEYYRITTKDFFFSFLSQDGRQESEWQSVKKKKEKKRPTIVNMDFPTVNQTREF